MLEEALQIIAEARHAPARPAQQAGRNEPCPCGSGKKHKKCCLGKTTAAPVAVEPQDIMPPVHDQSALSAAFERLGDLLDEDAGLRALGFDVERVARFADTVRDDAQLAHAPLETLATAYAEAHVGRDAFLAVDRALTEAVRRHLTSERDLQALLTGLMFVAPFLSGDAQAPQRTDNPLVALLFQRALAHSDQGVLHQMAEAMLAGLPHDPDAPDALLDRDTLHQLTERVTQRFAEDPASQAALSRAFSRQLEALERAIADGSFPVGFPQASALPVVDVMLSRYRRGDPRPDLEEVRASALSEAVAQASSDEDAQLFASLLRSWLDDFPPGAEGAEQRLRVEMMLALVEQGQLADWTLRFVTSGIKLGMAIFDAEEDLQMIDDAGLVPDDLERAAEIYRQEGYPGIAERTRALAGRVRARLAVAGRDR